MTIDLTINIWQEGQQFVAHALPLDVMSSGPTPEAARQAVDEAVRCFLKAAADHGTLEQILEECGFERALELDQRVWEVMAKIQARKARELTGSKGNSPEELARCFSLKLTADGHDFEVSVTSGEVRYLVRSCPWLELMRKSDRQHLAAKVAQTICPTEGRTWCAEFGGQYEFAMPQMGAREGARASYVSRARPVTKMAARPPEGNGRRPRGR